MLKQNLETFLFIYLISIFPKLIKMLEKFVLTQYSRVIFDNLNNENKILFRKLETGLKKLPTTEII